MKQQLSDSLVRNVVWRSVVWRSVVWRSVVWRSVVWRSVPLRQMTFILFFCFLSIITHAQTSDSSRIAALFNGEWKVLPAQTYPPDTIYLIPRQDMMNVYGDWMTFREGGHFLDEYHAPCGNDERIHGFVGKWSLSPDGKELHTTVQHYFTHFRSRIISASHSRIVLLVDPNDPEPITPKNPH